MADIIIRFTGDASGLASFYQGVARQTDDFVQRLTKTYRGEFANIISTPSGSALKLFDSKSLFGRLSQSGTGIKSLKYEIDQLNNVLKVTASTGLKLSGARGFLDVASTPIFRGNADELTKNLIAQNDILEKRQRLLNRARQGRNALTEITAPAGQALVDAQNNRDAQAAALASARAQRSAITEQLRLRREFEASLVRPLSGVAKTAFDDKTNRLLQERVGLQKDVERATRALTNAQKQYDAALADPRLTNYDQRLSQLATKVNTRRAALTSNLAALRQQEASILTSAPSVFPAGYTQLQKLSPQLQKILTRGGLATTPSALYGQNATFNAPTQDLVRGVTEVSGAFENNKGIMTRWAAELDKNGKVVTRFGGNLSGISRIGSQIVRDFQKVIEWTVATTVVFGGLATAVSALGTIKQLDVDLKRFSITAQLTSTESAKFFGQISEVAQSTATPIEELVKAADDIALAVKKPGQSTEQLTHDVLALSEAVGIFTNLTGQDTVTATNQLVAVMKQLGLEAGSVVGVLDKITAVAGGQSQAISDITQGLSVMAEAGKQANLTVDQQIATIQVLAQVTSKSPAEIATAFKNLVGAIQNPAGVKALEKYGIALHDLRTGELRNLIDIYTEIQQKISSGVIPQGEVSKLIRDISGGPRRAPDAAALLANITQVNRVTETSKNATNEALLANAQVLDTVQAKFIQFQNVLKSAAFQQVIGAFREITAAVIQLGTALVKLISSLPAGFIAFAGKATLAALALGLFFKVVRGAGTIFSALGISLRGVVTAEAAVGESALASARLVDASGNLIVSSIEKQATRVSKLRGILGRFGGSLGSAALGAGIGAAAGGNLQSVAGGALQGLGVGLLTIPEPTGLTKLAGIVALLGGTLLPQLVQSEQDVTESSRQHAQAVLQVYDAYRDSLTVLNTAKKSQQDLNSEYDLINSKTKKTPEDLSRLVQIQKELGDAFQQSVTATSQLQKSIAELAGVDPGLALMAQQAKDGALSIQDLDLEVQHLQRDLLKSQFPELQLPSEQSIPTFTPSPTPGTGHTATGTTSQIIASATGKGGTFQSTELKQLTVDLTRLGEEGNNVKNIFDETGKVIKLSFDPNTFNIGAIESALSRLPDSEAEFRDNALAAVKALAVQNNELIQAVTLVSAYSKILDARKPFITQEDYDTGVKFLHIMQGIIDAFNGGFINKNQFDSLFAQASGAFAGSSEINAATGFTTGKMGENPTATIRLLVKGLAEATGQTKGLTEGSDEYNAKLNQIGLNITGINNLFGETRTKVDDISEAVITLSENLDQAAASALSSLSDKSLQLLNDLKNGTIDSAEYAKGKAAIDAQRVSVIQLKDALKEAALEGGDSFVQSLQDVSKSLEGIPGLENASALSADQLISKFLSIAETMGFTKDETDKFTRALLKLIDTAKIIDQIKARLGITVAVSGVKELRQLLLGMKASLAVGAGIAAIFGGTAPNVSGQIAAIDAALAQLSGYNDSAASDAYKVISGAKGTGGSSSKKKSTTKKAPGFDVSTLDLPDEIANATNRNALIQEAIKRARELQSKVPGATTEAKNDIVELLKGTQRILEVRGVKDDFLRKALEELADIEKKRLEFETKADTIRRIRINNGSFASIANVPVNTQTGISLGGPSGPINITLNLNGTILTPAQLSQFADLIASSLKRQIANG